jgi:hypothetical protein
MQKLKRLSVGLLPHRLAIGHTVLLLLCCFIVFTSQASAVIRFTNRSLFIQDPSPGVTTQYKISLTYTTQTTVGSIDMLFCGGINSPIPTEPCNPPDGLDLSNAILSDQTGETGYTLNILAPNHIVLSRNPDVVGQTPSTYTLDNVVNPTDMSHSFAVRLSDYASSDASGPLIDLGSVVSAINLGVTIETQVPPMLLFCVGQAVDLGCISTNGIHYQNLGNLSPDTPLYTQSQMSAATNASGGYVITANGPTMEAGTHVIDALSTQTASAPGNSQFGINLRENSSPQVGEEPVGASNNAVIAPGYDMPNVYQYHDGDVLASADGVSLFRRFTVSYVINVPPNLLPGDYTTTITYICTGRF